MFNRDHTSYLVIPDPAEGCDEDYPFDFLHYGKKRCCAGKPEDSAYYEPDYHQYCNHEEKLRGKNHLLQIVLNIPVPMSFQNLETKFRIFLILENAGFTHF